MITFKKIQKIKTHDGYMIPIYRDWDYQINERHIPKMVYATMLESNIEKDIILHERRSTYMTCIQGTIEFETYNIDGTIKKYFLSSKEDVNGLINLIIATANTPIKLSNLTNELAIVINCPDHSWHPDDTDTIKFKNWSEFKAWKKD